MSQSGAAGASAAGESGVGGGTGGAGVTGFAGVAGSTSAGPSPSAGAPGGSGPGTGGSGGQSLGGGPVTVGGGGQRPNGGFGGGGQGPTEPASGGQGLGGGPATGGRGAGGSSDPGSGGQGDSRVTGPPSFECVNPSVHINQATGWEQCEGFLHRPAAGECRTDLSASTDQNQGGYGGAATCSTDADCGGLRYGHCAEQFFGYPTTCRSGCVTDADCAPDEVCFCDTPAGYCISASCRSDADCGDYLCATYRDCGQPINAVSCLSAGDMCTSGANCAAGLACFFDQPRSCINAGGCGG